MSDERTPDKDPTRVSTFGPSALATPANAITFSRLLLTPVFIALVISQGATWLAAALGAIVAFSDGLDGIVARRQGTTSSGAFLDPLIDKVVVLSCMATLAIHPINGHRMSWLPIAVIALRELAMMVYRSRVAQFGISIPARRNAKLKTMLQDLAIAVVVFPWTQHLYWLHVLVLWMAVAMTIITGYEYFLDGRRLLAERSTGEPGEG
ncbi:MAG: CDP-alcohol phosphatidyltransferase family protein [Actinobacteria bacterium]|nr:CDP-alcohol phosphatidyltransferase family protein [Actinomycetota bacterium]